MNVDRLYTVIRESNNSRKLSVIKSGKNAHKNYKRRQRKRRRSDTNDNDGQSPNKRRKLNT